MATLQKVRGIRLNDWGFTDTAPDAGDGGSSLKRILLAVTESDPCTRAISVAAGLARTEGSEVFVVHFVERLFLGRAGFWSRETPDEASQFVTRVRAEMARLGVRAAGRTDRTRAEEIATRIVWAANDFGANVIVVGTRGKSALQAVLRGSVSHEIIHKSRIPVVVVP